MRIAIWLMVGLGVVSAVHAQAPSVSDKVALYASMGPELTHYELDSVAPHSVSTPCPAPCDVTANRHGYQRAQSICRSI